jgi:hypothetical protein
MADISLLIGAVRSVYRDMIHTGDLYVNLIARR